MALFQPAPKSAEDIERAKPLAIPPDEVLDYDEDTWYEKVYRGDDVPQLTIRAVLMGSALGFLLAFTNLYIGLKTGWGLGVAMVTSFADGTKVSYEQAIVANGTGMRAPKRGLYAWEHSGHVDELTTRYDLDDLERQGGIVDYVIGAQPAPGVYVIATHDDELELHYMKLYKRGDGPLYAFYTPQHLCHFEAPLSECRLAERQGPFENPARFDVGPHATVSGTDTAQ